MKFDIFGIESGCMDLNVNVDLLPERNKFARVNEMSWQGGGMVSTGIIASTRLGAKCAIAGTFGTDTFGKACYQDFIYHNVDIGNLILRENETTSFDVVISEVEHMSRNLHYIPGTVSPIREDEIDWNLLKESRVLYVASTNPIEELAMQKAKENNVKVFFDANGYSEKTVAMFPYIDILIGSEFMFDGLFPDVNKDNLADLEPYIREVMSRGPQIVIFTFGENGCVGIDENDECFVQPAFKVKVKDTVGAGDVFHGAFIAEYLKNYGVRKAALYASATSAIKCTELGGRAAIPNEETLQHFIETGQILTEEITERVNHYRKGLENV